MYPQRSYRYNSDENNQTMKFGKNHINKCLSVAIVIIIALLIILVIVWNITVPKLVIKISKTSINIGEIPRTKIEITKSAITEKVTNCTEFFSFCLNITNGRIKQKDYIHQVDIEPCGGGRFLDHLLHYSSLTREDSGYLPVRIIPESIHQNVSLLRTTTKHKLTVILIMGLGNRMFEFAGMYGIARRLGMQPVVPSYTDLFKYFKFNGSVVEKSKSGRPGKSWAKYVLPQTKFPKAYHEITEALDPSVDIELTGYFQSWKYFRDVIPEVLDMFQFNDKISETANKYLLSVVNSEAARYTNTTVLVGIHIRYGDIHNLKAYSFVSKDFLARARDFYEKRFNSVIFVVCSDDLKWSSENFNSTKSAVVFSKGHSAVEDMAIMAHCNHTVMTIGTYSWWASFLSPGLTVYQKDCANYDFLKKKSSTCLPTKRFYDDTYRPDWIGL